MRSGKTSVTVDNQQVIVEWEPDRVTIRLPDFTFDVENDIMLDGSAEELAALLHELFWAKAQAERPR